MPSREQQADMTIEALQQENKELKISLYIIVGFFLLLILRASSR